MDLTDLQPYALALLAIITLRVIWYFIVLWNQANDDYTKK